MSLVLGIHSGGRHFVGGGATAGTTIAVGEVLSIDVATTTQNSLELQPAIAQLELEETIGEI